MCFFSVFYAFFNNKYVILFDWYKVNKIIKKWLQEQNEEMLLQAWHLFSWAASGTLQSGPLFSPKNLSQVVTLMLMEQGALAVIPKMSMQHIHVYCLLILLGLKYIW